MQGLETKTPKENKREYFQDDVCFQVVAPCVCFLFVHPYISKECAIFARCLLMSHLLVFWHFPLQKKCPLTEPVCS